MSVAAGRAVAAQRSTMRAVVQRRYGPPDVHTRGKVVVTMPATTANPRPDPTDDHGPAAHAAAGPAREGSHRCAHKPPAWPDPWRSVACR